MDLGRNLEAIRRQRGEWQEADLTGRDDEAAVRATLLSWLPPGNSGAITELGLGPHCGPLRHFEGQVRYQGFDRRLSARERAAGRAPAASTITSLPEGAEFPLSEASQDLFISLFTLERLRMDELYMAIAEMRRIVKPGGYAALASLHPGDSWWERLAARFHARAGRGTPVQLAHYLSPEDWDTVREGRQRLGGGRVAGLALLRRRADEPLSALF